MVQLEDVTALFLALVAQLEQDAALMGVLVWPLDPIDELALVPPRPDELVLAPDREPPSLYVLHREAAKLYEEVEEYRVPLRAEDFMAAGGDVRCYYRCFRTAEGIAHGWEYERAVYFEHYPPAPRV